MKGVPPWTLLLFGHPVVRIWRFAVLPAGSGSVRNE